MKAEILIKKTVEIKYVIVDIAVRYGVEDIPLDFPLRKDDRWKATIDIDNGKILEWTLGAKGHLHMKVCDEGTYHLVDVENNIVASIEEDYVPNDLIPGEYGDYIDLHINEYGTITNWYSKPSIDDFLDN